jgi:hypothetical protein
MTGKFSRVAETTACNTRLRRIIPSGFLAKASLHQPPLTDSSASTTDGTPGLNPIQVSGDLPCLPAYGPWRCSEAEAGELGRYNITRQNSVAPKKRGRDRSDMVPCPRDNGRLPHLHTKSTQNEQKLHESGGALHAQMAYNYPILTKRAM